jgi:hypothetical protein
MRTFLILGALGATVTSLGGMPLAKASAQPAQSWEIGPIIRGRNYSVNMPLNPTPAGRGWSFDFPYPHAGVGHVHYVTTRTGPLLHKSRIIVRYRIDAAPGVRFVPKDRPKAVAQLSLYIQRRGDNWSARRQFEHYRWYATPANRVPLAPGEHEIALELDPANWKSLKMATGDEVPEQFHSTLADADRVGLLFGYNGGPGHGVFATGPARFRLLSFRIV